MRPPTGEVVETQCSRGVLAVANPQGHRESAPKKKNARHFTMKGRAFEEAVDLSGGKTDGPLWREVYIGLGSSVRLTPATAVTRLVNPARTVMVW
jgi:hypothetical protein